MTETPAALLLHPNDNIWIACRDITKGETIIVNELVVLMQNDIPVGHKIAFKNLRAGVKITRYGASIGSLTKNIEKGEHIHTHNLKSDYLQSHDRGAVGSDEGKL